MKHQNANTIDLNLFEKAAKLIISFFFAVFMAFIIAALYIGFQEMPKRFAGAKAQYIEYQLLKEKHQANSLNE